MPAYAVIFGLAPDPLFWKTIGFARVPVPVIAILADRVSVYPADTLKVTPPLPTPCVLRADTAAEMVA